MSGKEGERTLSTTIEELQHTEVEPKPLGTVRLECHYPVVAFGLKEILKDEAEVHEVRGRPPGGEDLTSVIILCPNGRDDIAWEVRRLRASNPKAAVLVFETRIDPQLALKALRAGASGFIYAGMRPEQIVHAVRLASEGKAVIPDEGLLETLIAEETEMADPSLLTPRQREIVELVCEGMSNAQIAERLFLTESTVKQHLYRAYKAMKVRNRIQAAMLLRGA
jgi:RNA polymerase sigma factor (sigma-70 family)